MRINKLILVNYTRFSLNTISKLIYTPKHKTQIIGGSNGSGKSSLMSELSPLPADINRFYSEDGYKEIDITHNGKHYLLISGKEGRLKHNFIVNDIELNQGHTKKVQLQLVKQHFNIHGRC